MENAKIIVGARRQNPNLTLALKQKSLEHKSDAKLCFYNYSILYIIKQSFI